ncbi:hypothetical protein ACH5AL_20385 [Actinacidiphila glaucinigra]|uniref:hypothetical protein n=1 Tax=Actinacidiphila glaucinigra TaxID=235986 RepID=UPI0037AA2E39
MSHSEDAVYEARHGLDRRTSGVLAVAVLFSAVLLMPGTGTPLVLRIAGTVLFAGGGLVMAAGALTRKVAFRVDGTGVLLGGSPLRYRATTVHIPWEDITEVVLWRQRVPNASIPWVGVRRRDGAPSLPGPGQGAITRAVGGALVPVPFEVLQSSRAVSGWRLDRQRLADAVAHFAPGLRIVDGH